MKIHLIRTHRSTPASRALLQAGPPHPEHLVKQPPPGSGGSVAFGPGVGTPPERNFQQRRRWMLNVTDGVSLPFGWTLAIEGKRRADHVRIWQE